MDHKEQQTSPDMQRRLRSQVSGGSGCVQSSTCLAHRCRAVLCRHTADLHIASEITEDLLVVFKYWCCRARSLKHKELSEYDLRKLEAEGDKKDRDRKIQGRIEVRSIAPQD